jgi:hypothetical protein
MDDSKPKVVVGQKIWAVVKIVAGDVDAPDLKSQMSTDSKR